MNYGTQWHHLRTTRLVFVGGAYITLYTCMNRRYTLFLMCSFYSCACARSCVLHVYSTHTQCERIRKQKQTYYAMATLNMNRDNDRNMCAAVVVLCVCVCASSTREEKKKKKKRCLNYARKQTIEQAHARAHTTTNKVNNIPSNKQI